MPIVSLLVGRSSADECGQLALFPFNAIGEASFCNEWDTCQNLSVAPNGTVVLSVDGEPEWRPLTCDEAYEITHPLTFMDDNETMVDWESALEKKRRKDQDIHTMLYGDGRFVRTMEDLREYRELQGRMYEKSLAPTMKALEAEILAVAQGMLATFPRVEYSDAVQGRALRNITRLARQAGGWDLATSWKLRDSAGMRLYAWTVRAMLQLGFKQPTDSYLAGIAPFVHAFTFLQYRFRISYYGILKEARDLIVSLLLIHPGYTDAPWSLRLPMKMHQNQTPGPFYSIVSYELVDWREFLGQVEVALPDSGNVDDDIYNGLEAGLNLYTEDMDALYVPYNYLASETDRESTQIASMFLAADQNDINVTSICEGYRRAVEWVYFATRKPHILQPAILRRCKTTINIFDRAGLLSVYSQGVPSKARTRVWIEPHNQLGSLLVRLGAMDRHTLAGQLTFSIVGQPLNQTAVSRGIVHSWLQPLIDELFSTDLIERVVVSDGCEQYHPSPEKTTADTARAIGRLIALYLREGNPHGALDKYLRACTDEDTIAQVLFLNSTSVRRGIYDVYLPGDFELALTDGREAAKMVDYWLKRDSVSRVGSLTTK